MMFSVLESGTGRGRSLGMPIKTERIREPLFFKKHGGVAEDHFFFFFFCTTYSGLL